MGILEFKTQNYLVVVDFHSHYPELRKLSSKTSKDVIIALRSIFAVHGVPINVIADNMPFGSEMLRQFAKEWSFNITTSSPHYPKSNGMAERYVQTIKQFLKKADESNTDIYQSLLAYRQTPNAGLPYSPSELLFNRCIRGPLPYTDKTLTPIIPEAQETLLDRQQRQKQDYDKRATDLQPLQEGNNVLCRTDDAKHWSNGKVVAKCPQPRSYIIETDTGQVKRNRTHLKPVSNTSNADTEPTETDDSSISITESSTKERQPQTPVASSRTSARANRGTLPLRFNDYKMY